MGKPPAKPAKPQKPSSRKAASSRK
jgi:hypothetical protein